MVYQIGLAKIVRSTGLPKRSSALGGDGIGSTRNSSTSEILFPPSSQRRNATGGDFSCVQRLFFSKVNTATVRVLTANGCEVVIPKPVVVLPCPNTKDRQQPAGASSTDD